MIFIIFAFVQTVLAAPDADLLKPTPAVVRRNEVVEFKPKAGHHFSLEAPQKCASLQPVEASARVVKCQFLNAGDVTATLNVCDDAKTFCKPVSVGLKVSEQTAPDPVRLVRNEGRNHELKKALVPGFTTGSPDEITAQAAAGKKPVLMMISTDWCPPCNEAKEYLLVSPAFQAATREWFKVYVDGDSLMSVEWEKRVPYKYYPSFVLLNSKMEEIGRFNGELREGVFSAWAEEQSKYVNDPIAVLRERVLARKNGGVWQKIKGLFNKGNPAERHAEEVRLLKWALDQNKHDVIARVTEGANYSEVVVELTRYRLQRLQDEGKADKARQLALATDLVNATFRGDDWAESLSGLCEESAEECKKFVGKIPERVEFLEKREGLTESERASMIGEEYYNLANVFETLNNKSTEKEFADKCVAAYEKLKNLSRLKLGRGAQQTQMACFEMAGRFNEAEKRLQTLVEIYPNEPTFMVRMARLYRKQKKLDQALKWLDKADGVAYGFNWFSAQMIKSDVLLDLKRDQDAEKVLEEALKEVRLSEERDNRNQTVAARLRAAQAKIQSSRIVKSN